MSGRLEAEEPRIADGPSGAAPSAALTAEQLATMTVEEVWHHFQEGDGDFKGVLQETAIRLAKMHGLGMPDQATYKRVMTEARNEPFVSAVERAVLSTRNQATLPPEVIAEYNAGRDCKDIRSLCHAPATSMYFGRDGYVSACCYSRANPFGRYPDQGVAELWFGAKPKSMREQLRHNVLPLGCEKCADQFAARNYTGVLARTFDGFVPSPPNAAWEWLKRSAGVAPKPVYPVAMEFELSNKCNLECTMCSGFCSSSIRANRENRPPLPQLYGERFVEEIKDFVPHLQQARFFGGEPFLIDLYYDIWEIFTRANPSCEIFITTNGTVFTDKVQRVLEKLNCRITVSLDSVDKRNYEKIRKNATLERTLANVERFREVNRGRGQSMSLNVCPLVSNWHELTDIVDYASAREISVFFTTVTFPESASLKFLPRTEQERICAHLTRASREPENEVEARNFQALKDLVQQIESWMTTSQVHEPTPFAIV